MKKYKVAFATGSRADYGIVRNYISKLNNDSEIEFSILTTGALLASEFGSAIDIIENDGFRVDFKNKVDQKVGCLHDTVYIMATVLNDFSKFFAENKYDLLLILGDRYEIYSVSIAAAMHRIPILHMHGGELTIANYDEFIRHSITKMSHFHFTSTEEYRQRVIQLGEQPKDVYYLGALGAENCLSIDMNNVAEELKKLKDCFVVLFHPETLNSQSPLEQIKVVLEAVSKYIHQYSFIFIGSNADTHSDQITKTVKKFCDSNGNAKFYMNLHPDGYHYIVKHSIALIGNSSSGIIEVPSLGSFTINIGNRQTGRVKSVSILDVNCETSAIIKAMDYAIAHKDEVITDTPYYKSNTAEAYYHTTKKILEELSTLSYKEFYDLKH